MLNASLGAAASAILNRPATLSLSVWHGISPALILSALTLVAVAAVYSLRDVVRTRTWRPAVGTEQLYLRMLSMLDAVEPRHRSATAQRLASLVRHGDRRGRRWRLDSRRCRLDRSLASRRGPRFGSTKLLIVVVIIAGAIAATLAKSTMAAVLSLGVVGYGVAMTFLLYGAPDLAMTQFSVETLTVVIYVLVFRHFRNLGPLSPPWCELAI